MAIKDLLLSQCDMMPIRERHRGIAAAYNARLSLSWLAPSPNERDEAGWNLDMETLSLMLTSPML